MKLRLLTGLSVLVCLSLASCYPYDESQGKKKPTKTTEMVKTPEEIAKAKEAEAKKKAEEEAKKKEAELSGAGNTTNPADTTAAVGGTPGGSTPGGTTPIGPKPPEPTKKDYPFAQKVPGKEGFVFSPYNQKVVDVRDIPPGTLVSDPTYPESEKKHFRVP